VRLDELVRRDGRAENLGKLRAASEFRLARTVGKEDVRNLDAEFVVAVKDLKYTLSLRDQAVTVDQDTVDIENESHVLSSSHLLA
jgi:hypothetical protein